MERQRIAQALADHGFRESGNAFYGAVDGYPVIAALQGKDQIRAVTAAFTVRKLPTGGQRKALLQALKAQALSLIHIWSGLWVRRSQRSSSRPIPRY